MNFLATPFEHLYNVLLYNLLTILTGLPESIHSMSFIVEAALPVFLAILYKVLESFITSTNQEA